MNITASNRLLKKLVWMAPTVGGVVGLVWILEFVLVRRLARGARIEDKFEFYADVVARAMEATPHVLMGETFALEAIIADVLTEFETKDGLENVARFS